VEMSSALLLVHDVTIPAINKEPIRSFSDFIFLGLVINYGFSDSEV
jgi:hypothetical protein